MYQQKSEHYTTSGLHRKHETTYTGQTGQDVIATDTASGSNVTHQNSSALDMKTMAT